MNGPASNWAVTFFTVSMVTTQSPVAFEQSPVQPAKVEFTSGVAYSVTIEFTGKSRDLVPSVLARPLGLLFTEPLPAPEIVTTSSQVGTTGA